MKSDGGHTGALRRPRRAQGDGDGLRVRRMDKRGRSRKSVEEFGTTTAEILRLADWRARAKVTHVAMESTGVYWKPLWNLLESRFEMVLCNAQHIKGVPGRKTDVQDCEWRAQLLQH